ncbi:MAG: hypothetical protein DRH04_11400, partial [Deltaproteobacteria bacterium]
DIAASFDLSFTMNNILEVEHGLINFNFHLETGADFVPDAGTTRFTLAGLNFGRLALHLGDLLTLETENASLNFMAGGDGLLFSADSLELRFDNDIPALAGWGGTATNFGFGADGTLYLLEGAGITVSLPTGENSPIPLPDWLPVQIDEVGIIFHQDDGDVIPGSGGRVALTSFDNFSLLISGSVLEGDHSFPVPLKGGFEDMLVNVPKLIEWFGDPSQEFPITNLDGFYLEFNPFDLVEGSSFEIGGGFGLGITDSGTMYGMIEGSFAYGGIGAGISLALSELGPIAAQITVPVGLPLDPAGAIILASVEGGIVFGTPLIPRLTDPMDLLNYDLSSLINVDFSKIDDLLEDLDGRPTWELPFTIGLEGILTTAYAPGILTGDLTVGLNVELPIDGGGGLNYLGGGNISIMGMPLGQTGAIINLTNPLAPQYDFAFAAPAPGNPLGFLFPAQQQFSIHLSTEGIIEGPLLGMSSFLDSVMDNEADFFIDYLANSLEGDHNRPVAQVLLDLNGNGTVDAAENNQVIDAVFLADRVQNILPSNLEELAALDGENHNSEREQLATFTTGLIQELYAAIQRFNADPVSAAIELGIEAGPTVTELVNELPDLLASSFITALDIAIDRFDPQLAIKGVMQPAMFGFPMGDPTSEVSLFLSKDKAEFMVGGSIIGTMKQQLNLMVAGGLASGLVGPMIDMMTLGLTDQLQLTFSKDLPTSELMANLLHSSGSEEDITALTAMLVDALNPLSAWDAGIQGQVNFLGLEIADVSGFMFNPESDWLDPDSVNCKIQLLDTDDIDGADIEPDGNSNLIPVGKKSQLENMQQYGGVLLTGQLSLPSVLRDPVNVLAQIDQLTTDV